MPIHGTLTEPLVDTAEKWTKSNVNGGAVSKYEAAALHEELLYDSTRAVLEQEKKEQLAANMELRKELAAQMRQQQDQEAGHEHQEEEEHERRDEQPQPANWVRSPPQAEGWKTVGENTSTDNSGNCWGRVELLKRMVVVRVIEEGSSLDETAPEGGGGDRCHRYESWCICIYNSMGRKRRLFF